jgi:hypothetical protein
VKDKKEKKNLSKKWENPSEQTQFANGLEEVKSFEI